MSIVRNVLFKGLAGVVVIAGVGSLIALGIMAGVKVAYAGGSHQGLVNAESSDYALVLDSEQAHGAW